VQVRAAADAEAYWHALRRRDDMKIISFGPASFLAGGVAALAITALAQTPSPSAAAASKWEYQIVEDVERDRLSELSREGWEYAGYLGIGVKGGGNDQTLWRRAAK
jgi:hypothetical protein